MLLLSLLTSKMERRVPAPNPRLHTYKGGGKQGHVATTSKGRVGEQ